ncbi:MAG: hypothetical protein Tsb0014_16260 [Pleurocapsa sp.]
MVQSLLTSIEQETQEFTSITTQKRESIADNLDPWTESLIGVISLEKKNEQESYINCLE